MTSSGSNRLEVVSHDITRTSFSVLLAFLLFACSFLFLLPSAALAQRPSRRAPIMTADVVYLYSIFGRRMRRQLTPEQFKEFTYLRNTLSCRDFECAPACEAHAVNFGCPRCIAECAKDRVHARNVERLRAYVREEKEAAARAAQAAAEAAAARAAANTTATSPVTSHHTHA